MMGTGTYICVPVRRSWNTWHNHWNYLTGFCVPAARPRTPLTGPLNSVGGVYFCSLGHALQTGVAIGVSYSRQYTHISCTVIIMFILHNNHWYIVFYKIIPIRYWSDSIMFCTKCSFKIYSCNVKYSQVSLNNLAVFLLYVWYRHKGPGPAFFIMLICIFMIHYT